MKMNPGDVQVSGVSGCVVVEDIGYTVPNGVITTIPGNIACVSKNLWEYIGQGKIFKHSQLPAKPPAVEPDPVFEVQSVEPVRVESASDGLADLQRTNAHLQTELSRVHTEASRARLELEAEVGRLQAESAKLKAEAAAKKSSEGDALSLILDKLDKLPTQTLQISNQGSTPTPVSVDEVPVFEVPVFVPSRVNSKQSDPGRITLKQTTIDGASVTDAVKALREVRKKNR
jgi:hypothetical protein